MEPVPPTAGGRTPNIRDVARRAGVGVATVSRVINASPRVSEATNLRVRTAMADLGYRPNLSARSLSMGRSLAIGVIAPFFTSQSVVERLRGVSSRVAAAGYDLLLFDVETPEQRFGALDSFARADRMDGLLVISLPLTDAEVGRLGRDALPAVLIDGDHPSLAHIAIDDAEGGRLAAAHLLERGHRRLGFVGDDPVNPFGFVSSERRRRGFRDAAIAAGAAVTVARGPRGRESARALAETMLGSGDRPSAVFAASDTQAIGVLEAARALGLEVPGEVAIVGFDDIEVASVIGLTTVRQPLFQTGAIGAGMLLQRLGASAEAPPELEPLTLVARATT